MDLDLDIGLDINGMITKLLWIMKVFEDYLLKALNGITGQNKTWDEWMN